VASTISYRLATALSLIVVGVSVSHAEPCSLSSLSWMAGTWRSTTDPQGAQERWAVAPQSVLMGSAWEFPKGSPGYAEFMTVKAIMRVRI